MEHGGQLSSTRGPHLPPPALPVDLQGLNGSIVVDNHNNLNSTFYTLYIVGTLSYPLLK